MKSFIALLFIFHSLIVCQKKQKLYILFRKVPGKVYIRTDSPPGFDIYAYKIKIDDDYQEDIFFDSTLDKEVVKPYNSNPSYKIGLHQKMVDLSKLEKYDIKNYNWLKNKIRSFSPFERLYQFYDKIYIVKIDSIIRKATITEVENVEIIE